MPVYNSKDLIVFVNNLEQMVNNMNVSISDWDKQKFKIISSMNKVDPAQQVAMNALVKADEALSEIGAATFKSTASRGKRLEDTLNQLRADMYEIAASVDGSGSGGGSLTEGVFYDELNNAIATVDATVEDGLKLDYRLQEITQVAKTGENLSKKNTIMPYKHKVEQAVSAFIVPVEEGIQLLDGDVTVLDLNGDPIINEFNRVITGKIAADGSVQLTTNPNQAFYAYFPVQMKLKDIPDDFLYLLMEQMIQKNSRVLEAVYRFEKTINTVLEDIEYMKGVRWTPDYSIMRNHQEIVKESITPKGLNVEVKDGLANLMFSYNDSPYLSHFIAEKWDDTKKAFVPYDGESGIIQK